MSSKAGGNLGVIVNPNSGESRRDSIKELRRNKEVENFKNRVKKNNKTGKSEMWLTYNSNKKRMIFPVLPEEVRISYPAKNDTVYVYGVGDVTIKKHPGAFTISFSSFFPAEVCQGSVGETHLSSVKTPKKRKEFLEKVMQIDAPAKFIFTGNPYNISIPCTIDFEITERGGDTHAIYFTITITEYKKVSVRKIRVKKKKKKGKVSKKSKRVSGKLQSIKHVIKKEDCLFNIAREHYGSGSRYMEIYQANKKIIGSNPNRLPVGKVLTLPK